MLAEDLLLCAVSFLVNVGILERNFFAAESDCFSVFLSRCLHVEWVLCVSCLLLSLEAVHSILLVRDHWSERCMWLLVLSILPSSRQPLSYKPSLQMGSKTQIISDPRTVHVNCNLPGFRY